MSILTKVTTGRKGRAQKVVVYAPEGFGKSTLASLFPDPLFLDVEDSTSQLDVRRLTRADIPSLKAFESALAEIALAKPCTTMVVDTVDWLEQMALEAIIAEAGNPKITGIEDFGYGKGYTIIRERVTLLLAKFDAVIAAGVNVVLLAHSKVSKFEPPDGAGPYDRYELKLTKQVAPLIKEWADMLLFGNWRTQVRERDKNESGATYKGVGGKERLMHCNRSAAWDAKNRHGLGDVEKWDIAVIEKAFRDVGAPWGAVTAAVVNPKTATPAESAGVPTPEQVDKFTPTAPASQVAPKTAVVSMDATPEGEDVELARICGPYATEVTAYLIEDKRIQPGQNYRNMPTDFAARVKKNPANFLKKVLNGKAVTA